METTATYSEHVCVMSLPADFNANQADLFRRSALENQEDGKRDFVVEASKVVSIDSQGLEALLWLVDICNEQLGQVCLAGAGDGLLEVLRITRLHGRLPNHADIDSAVRSME